jgi:hypothetical protein
MGFSSILKHLGLSGVYFHGSLGRRLRVPRNGEVCAMSSGSMKREVVVLTVILLSIISGPVAAESEIIDLEFSEPPVSDSDESRTLASLVKVQGTLGLCQDGLYLLTHYGDRSDLFREQNQKAIDHPLIQQTWRFCSVFSAGPEGSPLMGRNWDNQNVGSIIVSLYHPPGGYSSISFSRAIDVGFPLNVGLEEIVESPFGSKLLLAPFYAMDGINEHGLAVAVAGIRNTPVEPGDREPVYITFLIRKLLDRAKNVEEAVNLVEDYCPFDLDQNSLNGHLIVADASGRSVILEYDRDQWRHIYRDQSWQVMTTKPIYGVSDEEMRERCWRYRSISETLDTENGNVDWRSGMKILQDVEQKGTTWSIVYSLPTRELHFSVYQDWDTTYHLKAF